MGWGGRVETFGGGFGFWVGDFGHFGSGVLEAVMMGDVRS